MDDKKIGGFLILISILLLTVLFSYNSKLNMQSNSIGCNANPQCSKNSSILTLTNIFVGIIFSILSLGFYFIVFNRSNNELLNKLQNIEKEKKQLSKDQKFSLLLKALTQEEQIILKMIKEEEGITQSSLRHKSGFSKTKLSFLLSDLEKKNIIKKELFGKTNKVFMKGDILVV